MGIDESSDTDDCHSKTIVKVYACMFSNGKFKDFNADCEFHSDALEAVKNRYKL